MEVDIIQQINDFTAKFSYKNESVNFTRHINLSIRAEECQQFKTWIDVCNKNFFLEHLPPHYVPAFWNDKEDTNFVYTDISHAKMKVLIRIPFEDCRKAFEKVRDTYHKNLMKKFSGFLTVMESFPKITRKNQPTSDQTQPSTSDQTQPSTSDQTQPSTSDQTQPSTSDQTQPSTSDQTQPSTSDQTQPSTSDIGSSTFILPHYFLTPQLLSVTVLQQ